MPRTLYHKYARQKTKHFTKQIFTYIQIIHIIIYNNNNNNNKNNHYYNNSMEIIINKYKLRVFVCVVCVRGVCVCEWCV